MKIFKAIADISKLALNNPSRAVIQDILADFPRDADIHGYVVLVQPGDTAIDLPELKGRLNDLSFDGVVKHDDHYLACYLTSNEFAIEFVVPDAPWLPADVRDNLEAHAESWVPYVKAPPF